VQTSGVAVERKIMPKSCRLPGDIRFQASKWTHGNDSATVEIDMAIEGECGKSGDRPDVAIAVFAVQ
jgi:hypothetical protein